MYSWTLVFRGLKDRIVCETSMMMMRPATSHHTVVGGCGRMRRLLITASSSESRDCNFRTSAGAESINVIIELGPGLTSSAKAATAKAATETVRRCMPAPPSSTALLDAPLPFRTSARGVVRLNRARVPLPGRRGRSNTSPLIGTRCSSPVAKRNNHRAPVDNVAACVDRGRHGGSSQVRGDDDATGRR